MSELRKENLLMLGLPFARYYIAGNSIDELMDVVEYVDGLLTDILTELGYFKLDYTDQQKLAYEDKERGE